MTWTRRNSTGTFLINLAFPWQPRTSTFRRVKSGKYRTATKNTEMEQHKLNVAWKRAIQLLFHWCFSIKPSSEVWWEAICFSPPKFTAEAGQSEPDRVKVSTQLWGALALEAAWFSLILSGHEQTPALLSPNRTHMWLGPPLMSPGAGICCREVSLNLRCFCPSWFWFMWPRGVTWRCWDGISWQGGSYSHSCEGSAEGEEQLLVLFPSWNPRGMIPQGWTFTPTALKPILLQ